MKYLSSLILVSLGIIFWACRGQVPSKESKVSIDYGTESDSAIYYYLEGWKKIMDEGRWTESEEAFRKVIEFDDQFALGKILVGRISRDLEERENILNELDKLPEVDKTIDLILEVYKSSVHFVNLRERNQEISLTMRSEKDSISEGNHRLFVSINPESIYEKAEYIEILHYKYGAQVALDTLTSIVTNQQSSVPFFVGYEAVLQAELGQDEKSEQLLNKLDKLLDEDAPARYFTRASVYQAMDSLAAAKGMAERAYQLDSNHILAKAMVDLIE